MVEGIGHGAARARLADAGKEQPQQGCDVHGRADRGARRRADRMLIHHDRGGQVADLVHPWPVVMRHLVAQKQRVALLPLALGFHGDRVKDQRALARAGDAGEHDQLPLRDRHVNMLQVVLGCAEHFNFVRHAKKLSSFEIRAIIAYPQAVFNDRFGTKAAVRKDFFVFFPADHLHSK